MAVGTLIAPTGIEAAMGLASARAKTKEFFKDAPKSEFWLNIGYEVDVTLEDGTVATQFISLPRGVTLDSQLDQAVTSSNRDFAHLNGAKNDLIAQIKAAAALLRPGERTILTLEVELHRVNAPQAAASDPAVNPFIRRMNVVRD